jgi:Mn2+/Fe2+ NRAMP family transporter
MLRRTLHSLGPGMLLAATSIGGSHLVLAPSAGARFGYELLWLVLIAHLFKYHAFEFGPRLALGARMSLLTGYTKLPGPRNWAIWVGIVDMVLESVGVLAAVAGLTGSILAAATGTTQVALWTAAAIALCFVMLATGRYQLLTRSTMLMLAVLILGTVIAFLTTPPSFSDLSVALRPHYPPGSLVLVAAILGWMPTGVGVSIWHSLWILEDPNFSTSSTAAPTAKRTRFRLGLRDMRIGYLLSALLAVMFLSLGAEVLQPAGLVPEGVDTAITLSRIYTERLGSWMQPLFLLMAFFAMFSTTYTVMDGMPRTLVAAARHLRGDPDADRNDRGRLYWTYLLAMVVASLAVVRAVPDPVRLITILAALTFLFSPIYFVLNYWCVTRLIDDPSMRPSRAARWMAKVGVVFIVFTAGLLLYTEVFGR